MNSLSDILIEFALGESCDKKIEKKKQEIIQKANRFSAFAVIINHDSYFQGPIISESYREQSHPVRNLGYRFPKDRL